MRSEFSVLALLLAAPALAPLLLIARVLVLVGLVEAAGQRAERKLLFPSHRFWGREEPGLPPKDLREPKLLVRVEPCGGNVPIERGFAGSDQIPFKIRFMVSG